MVLPAGPVAVVVAARVSGTGFGILQNATTTV